MSAGAGTWSKPISWRPSTRARSPVAILDVFATEPLPPPPVPVASTGDRHPTRRQHVPPETAARAVIENLRCHRSGAPLLGLVDRGRGY